MNLKLFSTKGYRRFALTLFVLFLIVLVGFVCTEGLRARAPEINNLKEDISFARDGMYVSIERHNIGYKMKDDAKFHDFLADEAEKMLENGEFDVFSYYISMLERNGEAYRNIERINIAISNHFGSVAKMEECLEMFNLFELRDVKYYSKNLVMSENSGAIFRYIQANGTNSITTTPGEGYYSGRTNETTKDVVGLPNSPLFDAVSITYNGDFQLVHKYGVKLNYLYKEEAYSSKTYYFRDEYVPFGPNDGKCVWSGDYMFCFDADGNMKDYTKIDSQK